MDFFFALASVVADELYTLPLPLIALPEEEFAKLRTGDEVHITQAGAVLVYR